MGGPKVSAYLLVSLWSSGESYESIGEVDSDGSEAFSTNDSNLEPKKDDLTMVVILQGIICLERMHQLVLRYGVTSKYVHMITNDIKYISTPSLLEIKVYEESFQVGFHLPMHLFIETFPSKCGLVPA